MPKSIRQDVIDAAEELSHYTPRHKSEMGKWVCPYCWSRPEQDKYTCLDEIITWLQNPQNHKEFCPWRVLKEALANLD